MQPLVNTNRKIAIMSELLYLTNLLVFPGVAFLLLAYLFIKHRTGLSAVSKSHLTQTFYTSLVGGILIVMTLGLAFLLNGFENEYIWMWTILYFTLIHSTLVVFGALGLAKAMSNQSWEFPLIGCYLPKD